MGTLIDLDSRINVMQSSFVRRLGLCICKINKNIEKIDGSSLKIYGIVIAYFQVDNKDGKPCFFKVIFMLAEIYMDIAFRILYISLSNVKININNRNLRCRSYTVVKILLNIR